MTKMNDVSVVEAASSRDGDDGWEQVEQYTRTNVRGQFVSSLLSLRKRIDRGFLVRTFYQFMDGIAIHVSMTETYVPDPNEQWSVKTSKRGVFGV